MERHRYVAHPEVIIDFTTRGKRMLRTVGLSIAACSLALLVFALLAMRTQGFPLGVFAIFALPVGIVLALLSISLPSGWLNAFGRWLEARSEQAVKKKFRNAQPDWAKTGNRDAAVGSESSDTSTRSGVMNLVLYQQGVYAAEGKDPLGTPNDTASTRSYGDDWD